MARFAHKMSYRMKTTSTLLTQEPQERSSKPVSLDFDRAACRFFRQFNGSPPRLNLNDFLIRFERAIIFNTLIEMNGCQRRAAAFLKLKNTTLNRKVKVQHIQFTKIPVLPGPVEPGRGGGGSPE